MNLLKKGKKSRIYYIRKKTVINEYEKTGKLRETALKFDISPGTLSGWIANMENIKVNNLKQNDSRFKGGGRKLDSEEFDGHYKFYKRTQSS